MTKVVADPGPANPCGGIYRLARGIRWVVETRGITLYREGVEENTGTLASLPYPQAALWDLLQRYRFAEMVELLGYVMNTDPVSARTWALEIIAAWTAAGYLTHEDANGEPGHYREM